jgi:hypothetical protein
MRYGSCKCIWHIILNCSNLCRAKHSFTWRELSEEKEKKKRRKREEKEKKKRRKREGREKGKRRKRGDKEEKKRRKRRKREGKEKEKRRKRGDKEEKEKEEKEKIKKITSTEKRDHVSDVCVLKIRMVHRQTMIMSD